MPTMYAALVAAARRAPGHPALIDGSGVRDYRWLLRATDGVAAALARTGVRAHQRIGLLCPNQAEFAPAFFAVARLGAAVVPLNPALLDPEIAAVCRDAAVSAALTIDAWRDRCARIVGAGSGATRVIGLEEATGARDGNDPDAAANDGDAPFLVLYSSGSTGRPKRVERTHRQLLWETERLAAALAMSPEDRVLGVAPFSHVNGLMRSMVLAILSGATLVPVPEFERRAVGRLIQDCKVTGFIGVPFMFAVLAETRWPQPVDLSSLRYCFSASAPLRPPVAQRFHDRYGVPVRQLYGTTETGTIALAAANAPLSSVGIPLPGIDVLVQDDAGRPLGPDEPGHIAIRSPAAATAYAGVGAEDAAAFRDEYFRPGDVARLDADGRIYLLGRTSLFINRGGFKVNPLEIEEALEQHPKVREAAVVGESTELGEERVKAVIVPRDPCTVTEILEFCQARMASFKVPSVVEFRDRLPKSSAGKILRRSL
jgi:long-chain acyl-CoA synthetase